MTIRRGFGLLVTAAAIAGAAGSCSSTTEVVVVVDGDVRGADTVVVRIESPGFEKEKTAVLAETPFPLTLGVEAGGDDGAAFTVRAVAKRGDVAIVTRVARTTFVSGESKVLLLSLCDACVGATCAGDTTCGNSGSCEPVFDRPAVDPWTGTPPKHTCTGAVATDAGADADAAKVDADVDAGPVEVLAGGFHVIGDARNWSAFDLTAVSASLRGYLGATFTGGYVYFAPDGSAATARHGNVVRYDTTKPFDAKASYEVFDLQTLDANATGYAGAVTFAASTPFPAFVYFVPYGTSTGDVVARYRTNVPFGTPGSWDIIKTETFSQTANAAGFGGALVNNSHVWLPTRTPTRPFALHSCRDTENPTRIIDAGWEHVDPRTEIDAGAVPGGYFGGAYDNTSQKMYFAPALASSLPHGVALSRQIGGGAKLGWTSFNLTTKDDGLRGYAGGVFDGQFVYFVPFENPKDVAHGKVVRYDTLKPFDAAASWQWIDLTKLDAKLAGFIGGVFDGRFVTFVPNKNGLVARYDTKAPFEDAAAWSSFDVAKAGAAPGARYAGGAFDGHFVYLVPATNTPLLRFEARDRVDLSVLATSHGSFL